MKVRTASIGWIWSFAILASLGLYGVAIWYGEVNQDEGWYLYAGRLVSEGQHPFVDFASTQGPVMAYVYALAQPLVRLWGVAGGRIFTAILGFSTALAAALLAYRVAESTRIRTKTGIDEEQDNEQDRESVYPPSALSSSHVPPSTVHSPRSTSLFAALAAFAFLGLNLYHVYFTTMVKTYSLAGLLVVLGFLALERALRTEIGDRSSGAGGRKAEIGDPPPTSHFLHPFFYAILAAALFALAAGVRLSAGILLPTIWLTLLFLWSRGGWQRQGLRVLMGFLLGGSVTLLAIYVPFMIMAPEALRFGLLDYHSGRTVGSLVVILAYKAGFLIRLTGAYFPLLALAVGCGALDVWRWLAVRGFGKDRAFVPSPDSPPPHSPHCPLPTFHVLLIPSLLVVTLVHLIAVFPYDDYQVFIMPLLAVLVAVGISRLFSAFHTPHSTARTPLSCLHVCSLLFTACCILLAHSASSPLLQNWLLARRDRIWWPLRTESSLQCLQRSGKMVRELAATEGQGTRSETRIDENDGRRPNDHSPQATVHTPQSTSPSPSSRPLTSDLRSPSPDLLLTQDTYLAVEAGLKVPAGMELGPFCYFPDMDREKAEALHLLNREMFREILASCESPIAAFSGYGLAIRCPEITELPIDEQTDLWTMVESRYEQVTEVTPFGQADTTLRVFERRSEGGGRRSSGGVGRRTETGNQVSEGGNLGGERLW